MKGILGCRSVSACLWPRLNFSFELGFVLGYLLF